MSVSILEYVTALGTEHTKWPNVLREPPPVGDYREQGFHRQGKSAIAVGSNFVRPAYLDLNHHEGQELPREQMSPTAILRNRFLSSRQVQDEIRPTVSVRP